jgi:hypothetical protein
MSSEFWSNDPLSQVICKKKENVCAALLASGVKKGLQSHLHLKLKHPILSGTGGY